MIDYGICKEHILQPTQATAALVVGAEAYWQGLYAAFNRTPALPEYDSSRLDGDGRLTGLVRILEDGDVAYERVGRALRSEDGDFTGRRLSEMRHWKVIQGVVRGHWDAVTRTGKPLIGEDWYDARSAFQWALLPFASGGERIDSALMVHDYDHLTDRYPSKSDVTEALIAAADRMSAAIFILSKDRRVSFANRRAVLFAELNGLVRVGSDRRLCTQSKTIANALVRFDPQSSPTCVRIVEGDHAVTIAAAAGSILLTVRSFSAEIDFQSVAQDAFGMPRAEARLVAALARGRSLDEAARDFGISIHTARTQIRSAMARMGLSRQQEVVRVMCLATGV